MVDSRHSWHTNLTSQTLGRNPRVHTKNPAPNFSLFSFFFSRKVLDLHLTQKPSSRPKVSLLIFLRTSHLSPLFKTTSNVSYPRERIKTRGYTFEFKSNLNSNKNQLIPILLGVRREGAWLFVRGKSFMRNLFSCK